MNARPFRASGQPPPEKPPKMPAPPPLGRPPYKRSRPDAAARAAIAAAETREKGED